MLETSYTKPFCLSPNFKLLKTFISRGAQIVKEDAHHYHFQTRLAKYSNAKFS